MRTKVKEISHKGSSSVVEWQDSSGNFNRSVLPSVEIIQDKEGLFVKDIEEGQPYGVDWESLIRTRMGPKAIVDLLHKNGIWTLEDYAQNTAAVTSAFNEACSANLQQFKESVLRKVRGESNEDGTRTV